MTDRNRLAHTQNLIRRIVQRQRISQLRTYALCCASYRYHRNEFLSERLCLPSAMAHRYHDLVGVDSTFLIQLEQAGDDFVVTQLAGPPIITPAISFGHGFV